MIGETYAKFDDSTPGYWREDGGLHITLGMGEAQATAIRPSGKSTWVICDCEFAQSELPADTTEENVKKLLIVLVRRALLTCLQELEKL